MFVIAIKDPTQVLGYRLFTGFRYPVGRYPELDLTGRFAVSDYESLDHKYVQAVLYPSFEFATHELDYTAAMLVRYEHIVPEMRVMNISDVQQAMLTWNKTTKKCG